MRSFLELKLTNTCNLDCKYCYEKPDLVYGKDVYIMDYKTAKKKILDYYNKFCKPYNLPFANVEFFGGEPMLAKDTIIELLKDKEITDIAKFSIISNCTIFSEELANLFLEHDVAVSFSIDAPRIHTLYRVKRDGSSSWDLVWGNFKKYYTIMGNKLSVRTTYVNPGDEDDIIQFAIYLYLQGIRNTTVNIVQGKDKESYGYIRFKLAKMLYNVRKYLEINPITYNVNTSLKLCSVDCGTCYSKSCPNSLYCKEDNYLFRYDIGGTDDEFEQKVFTNTGK